MPRVQNGQALINVPEDANGKFLANCSVCFEDKTCIGITYPHLVKIYEQLGVDGHGFAVCEDCFKNTEPKSLYKNLLDYFIMDELCRWLVWNKDGIIRSELEFKTLLSIAEEQGVLYREEKRTRHRYTKQERVMNMGLINMLKRENTGDYTSNPVFRGLFKKLMDGGHEG